MRTPKYEIELHQLPHVVIYGVYASCSNRKKLEYSIHLANRDSLRFTVTDIVNSKEYVYKHFIEAVVKYNELN